MKEKIYKLIAYHTPRELLYWMVIRSWAIVTTEKHTDKTPTEVTWDMVCKYFEAK